MSGRAKGFCSARTAVAILFYQDEAEDMVFTEDDSEGLSDLDDIEIEDEDFEEEMDEDYEEEDDDEGEDDDEETEEEE